jgi:EAL domain-containing protein (putative c-di-GMP-specific phosphodiesterase class I)
VGVDDSPAALELVDELRPPFVKLSSATAHQLTPNRLNELVQRLRRNQAEVIASGIDSPALVTPVWASGVGYAQGAVIQAPLPKPVFEWGEAVAG